MLAHPLFLIVDGMSQAYRAYFAIRGLATSRGIPTNAVYGFAVMFKRVLDKFTPEHVCVVLDRPERTVRHEQYDRYKAQRPKMPADLAEQIPYIKRLCAAMRIPLFEVPGYEADDVIASLAKLALTRGWHPVIVTMDKDMMQIVGDILILNTSRDDLIVDSAKVRELYDVDPEQIPDLLGLWGDASDNVPGAPGIGEKTAKELIRKFGSIDALLARTEEVPGARQRASLEQHRDQILLSRQLVTLHSDLPLNVDWEAFRSQEPDPSQLLPLLRELEFTNMVKEYQDAAKAPAAEILTADELPASLGPVVAIGLVGETLQVWSGSGAVVSVPAGAAMPLLAGGGMTKVVYGAKEMFLWGLTRGLEIRGPVEDPMLMAYLLNPNRGRYALGEVAFDLTGETTGEDRAGPTWRLFEVLSPQVEAQVSKVYRDIELPLAPILAEMEHIGIGVDRELLNRMSAEMGAQLEGLTGRIYAAAGTEFNINSPKQLGDVLFDKLNLPHSKKNRKSGQYSTAIEVLEELASTHELPRLILDYRQLAKLKSTYVDALPELIRPETGRLHTSFNQTGAATGRLSSSNPNLQNIPVRTEAGRRIRGAFVARPGCVFISADYSQVELRIVAHFSGDEGMRGAFLRGEDIHRRTAAEVLGIPLEAVTPDQRDRAKAVNFGIVYGQTPFGLAQQLGIGNDEAAEFIERYFTRYGGVRDYLEGVLREARDTGQVKTMFGRIRQIPEINSKNGLRRSMAERTAINAPIQGTAADIIKIAMIEIDRELKARRLETRMVLQVHDELIFEVPEPETAVGELIRERMQSVVTLSVPLTVDVRTGPNWEAMKTRPTVLPPR